MKNLTLLVYCKLRAFLADEEGANAIEYAVIAGLIAVALIAVLSPTDSGIVGRLKAFFDGVGEKVGGLAPTAN
ncbi:type 4b pilus Flp major pilin [Pseudomonas aeruginosa]|uniref:type 4b pilus Flp major pilin n=1 Tax=Pseudomonas aeruginosa TaxID=287 RepID=UPI00106768F8|nr:type 4b pilus Flp major pilin [Pseudomonas aeruginosa]TEN69716.1 type 4b pilus Flp major pilin [Pseudomonas aeruginosa]